MTRPVLTEGHPEAQQEENCVSPWKDKEKGKKKLREWPVGASTAFQSTPSSPFADWETEAQEAEAGPHGPGFHEISTKI